MGNKESKKEVDVDVYETYNFDSRLKGELLGLVSHSFEKLCTLYRVSTIKEKEISFFLDANGTLREIKTGDTNELTIKSGEYNQTFLSGHSHPPTVENVDGPSGEDLFTATGLVHDKLCNGEIILCPERIWIVIPSAERVEFFQHDPQLKYYEIGYGQGILKQYRTGRLTIENYLLALYDIGFDVLVLQKKMENC
jgi:hypothetical protein